MAHARIRRPDIRLVITVLGLASLLIAAGRAAASEPGARSTAATSARIQKVVDAIREDLGVTHPVSVQLVAANPLKASVEPVKGAPGTYRLEIERAFLDELNDEELRAVVAHELGHVWIYTHHPYLQTEQLANKIALRVVSRATLEKVYGKVWAADASAAGSLKRFPD
jgi:predicted Zn-dependent protease